MATLLAPYNTAMQLGTGFNSFTQQLCIDNAVVRDPNLKREIAPLPAEKEVAQIVSYKTCVIDKVTDVTNAMNINAAFSIKYDTVNASGKGDFINTSKIKESDASFMISVKVINQSIYDHSLTQFDPISGIKPSNFADVYGDCFISGYQEGGEFTAIISVKGKDQDQSDRIKVEAKIGFTKDKLSGSMKGLFDKTTSSLMTENETTVSVIWSGGGQNLKGHDQDWTLETMRAAALKFPELVAKTPVRTHAILTKYTALRRYYSNNLAVTIPPFERAGIYCNMLQEVYLDYKTISKDLQVTAYDVSAGLLTLEAPTTNLDPVKTVENADPPSSSDLSEREGPTDAITKPFAPSLQGLESAKNFCRVMLTRIVAEVDIVTREPEVALDEKRRLPYMSPFVFKSYIPVAKKIQDPVSEAPASDNASFADQLARRF